MQITVVQNDSGYRQHEATQLPRILGTAFPSAQIQVLQTNSEGGAFELAANSLARSDYVVTVGDDRTLHELINATLGSVQAHSGNELPVFSLLPLGTHSDFNHALGVEGDIHELCEMISQDSSRPVDVGRVRYNNDNGDTEECFFINAMDVGIGASVLKHMVTGGRYLGGNLHYLESILASLFENRDIELHVETDTGVSWRERTLAVVATNSGYHSDGIRLTTDPFIDEGQLLITLVKDIRAVDLLRNLHGLRIADQPRQPGFIYEKAGWLRITATRGAAPVQADGRFLGSTPVEVDVLQERVRFLCPPRSA